MPARLPSCSVANIDNSNTDSDTAGHYYSQRYYHIQQIMNGGFNQQAHPILGLDPPKYNIIDQDSEEESSTDGWFRAVWHEWLFHKRVRWMNKLSQNPRNIRQRRVTIITVRLAWPGKKQRSTWQMLASIIHGDTKIWWKLNKERKALASSRPKEGNWKNKSTKESQIQLHVETKNGHKFNTHKNHLFVSNLAWGWTQNPCTTIENHTISPKHKTLDTNSAPGKTIYLCPTQGRVGHKMHSKPNKIHKFQKLGKTISKPGVQFVSKPTLGWTQDSLLARWPKRVQVRSGWTLCVWIGLLEFAGLSVGFFEFPTLLPTDVCVPKSSLSVGKLKNWTHPR